MIFDSKSRMGLVNIDHGCLKPTKSGSELKPTKNGMLNGD